MAQPRRSMVQPSPELDSSVSATTPHREVKLPPFEEDMPQAWFNQAEAYFRLNNVHDHTFWFYYVQWALLPQQKKLVRDLLSMPTPPATAYDQLKEQLLQL